MTKPWHEDPLFWRLAQPFLFTEERWRKTPAQVSQIVRRCGMKRGMRVLDLCCGTGRVSLELARRGYVVTGVDAQEGYLREAKRRAKREHVHVRFLLGDMRTFKRSEAFDVVLNIFTSFGYFRDQRQNMRVLKNTYASLKPGGRLCMETRLGEDLRNTFTPRVWAQLPGVFLLEEIRPRRDWKWLENRWIFIRGGRRREFTLSHYLYGERDLHRMLKAVGFRSVRISRDGKRLIVVAERGEGER